MGARLHLSLEGEVAPKGAGEGEAPPTTPAFPCAAFCVIYLHTTSIGSWYSDMPTLEWIGKKAVVNHHNEVPFRLLKTNASLSVGEPGNKKWTLNCTT